MATAMTRRRWVGDDDDETFDDEVFDRRYFPRRVYRDGHGPHVSLMLTDGSRAPRAPVMHKPGFAQARLSDAQIDVREQALAARSARIRDAWRGSPMAPDDRDVFELAQRLAPLFHLPAPIATRSPIDADPDADVDPGAVDPRQAALDARSRWKQGAWKTRARR
jgi:hypothetical protein